VPIQQQAAVLSAPGQATDAMAAACASWSAGQHLASLGNLATKLDRLERQAELLDSWQEEREQVCVCRDAQCLCVPARASAQN
jgi:hypothetical protein